MSQTAEQPAAAGFTALHKAAHAGAADEVDALLEAGAVATALTAQSDSALHLAALGGHVSVTRMLLAAAPSLLAETNVGGWSPLMLAVLSPAPPLHRMRCTALLLEAKADSWAATAQVNVGSLQLHIDQFCAQPCAALRSPAQLHILYLGP